ncbi:MAG: DUF503 domain-containing protein [Phycisphaerae bacterium]|nr:DUF503 domain-containing protein [Phycisphaerae bacterium]
MVIGVLQAQLLIRESRSLKDKRRVIKSLKERLSNRFNISIAEVGANEAYQQAVIGVAMVSNDHTHVQGALDQVVSFMQNDPRAELVEFQIEFL